MNERDRDGGLPVEQFIQALTSQLDRAQSALALKARMGLPLTFAVKDFTLDLRTHVDVAGSVVRIRPAGPGESEASTLHLALTTITRPMIEENTFSLAVDPDEPPLREAVGGELTEDELRRLEWAGVQTSSQLVDLERRAGTSTIERLAAVPALRLKAALDRASRPRVSSVVTDPAPLRPGAGPRIRIRGRNLAGDVPPEVRIGGEKARVVESGDRELLVETLAHQLGQPIVVETSRGRSVETPCPVGTADSAAKGASA